MKTGKYKITLDLKMKGQLSQVVCLVDDFTGIEPTGNIRVWLPERECKMIKKTGGYYLFFDVPVGKYTVRVESDYYFTEENGVEISGKDPLNHIETIRLQPKPCYPFPGGATLIRGMVVQDSAGEPVIGAAVEIIDFWQGKVKSETTVDGEFVLYFPVLGEDDSFLFEDGKVYVRGKKEEEKKEILNLKASLDSMAGGTELEWVEEGRTTLVKSPIILSK